MPKKKITWTKIGILSFGGSAVLIGYLYYKRRYPKYETIEPAPRKMKSLEEAKEELVQILLPDRLCTFHAGLGFTMSLAYFSYLKIECALKASVAYLVASQVSKLKFLDVEVTWWPSTQGQDTLTAGEILELIIKLSTTTYLAQQAFRDLMPALSIVAVSSVPCLLDCVWIPRHRLDQVETLVRDCFVPKLPLLATLISSRKEYFRVELIRDIRSIFAANTNSEYISQQDLVNELADKMITRIVRYIMKELGKEAKRKLPSYVYVCYFSSMRVLLLIDACVTSHRCVCFTSHRRLHHAQTNSAIITDTEALKCTFHHHTQNVCTDKWTRRLKN